MELVFTTIAALIASLAGSWVGANIALSRFKKERAFDRQLDWYERVIRCLHDMAQKIEIAVTFQSEPDSSPEHLMRCWRDVQHCHLVLGTVAVEAHLYGSRHVAGMTTEIADGVQDIANKTEAFDPRAWNENETEEFLNLIGELPEKLRGAAKPLALEARRHLRLSESSSPSGRFVASPTEFRNGPQYPWHNLGLLVGAIAGYAVARLLSLDQASVAIVTLATGIIGLWVATLALRHRLLRKLSSLLPTKVTEHE